MEAATAEQRTPEGASTTPLTETYHFSVSSNPTLEDQLFELVRLSDVPMSKQLFDVVVELLRLNIPPSAILHVMKTLRAQATQSTMPPSLQSSRPHSPPPPPPLTSSQSSSTTVRPPGEAATTKQTQRKSSSASKSSATSLHHSEGDKSSRKHRQASSSTGAHKSSSSRSAEKLRSSVKGGSRGKSKGQTQDTSNKVG